MPPCSCGGLAFNDYFAFFGGYFYDLADSSLGITGDYDNLVASLYMKLFSHYFSLH